MTYPHKFKEAWISQYTWVDCKDGKSFCKVCNGFVAGDSTHMKRHDGSKRHNEKLRTAMSTPSIKAYSYCNITDEKAVRHAKAVFSSELKLVMFLHEHNLPFLLMEHLPQFLKSVCPDFQIAKDIKCSRMRATLITNDCMSKESLLGLQQQLPECDGLYSLIIDESTDVSLKKALTVVIRYCSNVVRDRFFGLLKVNEATAEALFNAVLLLLRENNMDVMGMLGFAADNASVMMGQISGVQTRFKTIKL